MRYNYQAKKPFIRRICSILLIVTVVALAASACGEDDSSENASRQDSQDPSENTLMEDAVGTYARGVHSAYSVSLASARTMDDAISAFLDSPSPATLAGAKRAWLTAREDYGPTEAFRFYGGPIDDEETGTEGLINAWPLDEAYIDYVVGNPTAGIVNNPDEYPDIDAELLLSLNEQGGEANISTGWHAIEFLLWGQDLSTDGPGVRPVEDYTSNANAERRATYLTTASSLLIEHLEGLESAWAPKADNYRATFEALEPVDAMGKIFTGIGTLSVGELAGERMNVAYTQRSQEDEHSCFSDNTTRDIIGNALGIQMILIGEYPGGVTGTSLLDVIAATDTALAGRLRAEVVASLAAVSAIPAPFDQHLQDDVSDEDPGRQLVLAAIKALGVQADTIVAAASAIGITDVTTNV